MEVSFELAGLPPTPNAQRRYRHWSQRWRSDQQWKEDTRLLAVDARNRSGLAGFPWRRAQLRLTFYLPRANRRDADNLIAAAKPILDGVVAGGLIVDDSTDCLVAFGPHEFLHRRGQAGVRVTVGPA